jgi:SAM-dependent methyltransferase
MDSNETERYWKNRKVNSNTFKREIKSIIRNKHLFDYLDRIFNTENEIRILDVGCGSGYLLCNLIAYLKYKDKNYAISQIYYHGIDLNAERLKHTQTIMDHYNIEGILSNENFDTVELQTYDISFALNFFLHIHPDKIKQLMERFINSSNNQMIITYYKAPFAQELERHRKKCEKNGLKLNEMDCSTSTINSFLHNYPKLFNEINCNLNITSFLFQPLSHTTIFIIQKRK